MVQLVPQYAFVAGELSPEFKGRTDLVKYSLGAQLVHNFFVGYRGGLYSRAGSRMAGQVLDDDKETKIIRFRSTGDDYLLVLTDLKMRFMRNGGYILEAGKTITNITNASPAVVTSTAHSYTTGDWVFITDVVGLTEVNNRYLEVGITTANEFQLLNSDGTNLDTTTFDAYVSGGSSGRVYTIATTYASADLPTLQWEQEFNDVTITHLNYVPRKLTFVTDTNWTLADIVFGDTVAAPTPPTLTPSSAGSAGVAFAVTSVINGVESLPSDYTLNELSVNYTTTAGSMLVEWTGVAGADWYNVYRSLLLPTGAQISRSQEVGFLGRALAPQFTDNNIIPDFTKTPPVQTNPFADEVVQSIEVTAGGTGYAKSDTITLSGGGTGFVGFPIVNSAGVVIAISVINGGSGYTSPVVSFVTSGGSGATATATVGPASGNNPRVYKKFQQRGVYAGTSNFPMTLWGSKPKQPENFDISVTLNDGDSYEFELDAGVVKPILHMLALKSGLLSFTENAVTQLKASEGVALTPLNALAEPQLYKGIGIARPLAIGLDVVYAQDLGSALNVMAYTEYTNSFTPQNLAALSHHLLGEGKQVTRLEFVEEPDKLLYCLREDGVLLTLTYVREDEVFGWAQHSTKGLYKDSAAVKEEGGWSLYTVVRRFINGKWVKFIERTLPRAQERAEDYWCVDCGLEYEQETPAAELTAAANTGTGIAFETDASIFASGDVGKIIYLGGGKAEITAFVSGTEVTCTILRDITKVIPQDTTNKPVPAASGDWTMAVPVTSLSNLWHLEGETVSVLADGDGFIDKVVINGTVTWDSPATKVIVGLQYLCQMQSLPVASTRELLESRRKDMIGLGVQLYYSRGLAFGENFDNLVEMKDRTDEDWGEALKLRSDNSYEPINTPWDADGAIVAEQKYPLPATILSLIYDVDEGDDGYK